jgi:hypothetical protein
MKYKEYNGKSEKRLVLVGLVLAGLTIGLLIFTIVVACLGSWIGTLVGGLSTVTSFALLIAIDNMLGNRDDWGSKYCENGHWNRKDAVNCTDCGSKLKRKILYCSKCKEIEKYDSANNCAKCGCKLITIIEDID